jgi:hypothetical protein
LISGHQFRLAANWIRKKVAHLIDSLLRPNLFSPFMDDSQFRHCLMGINLWLLGAAAPLFIPRTLGICIVTP